MNKSATDCGLCSFDGDRDLPVPDGSGAVGSSKIRLDISASDIPEGTAPSCFFAAVFGYTLSRFSRSSKAVFPMIEQSIESDARASFHTFPVSVDCTDRQVSDFILSSSDSILNSKSNFNMCFKEMNDSYGIDSAVVFEFLASSYNDIHPKSEDTTSDILLTVSQSDHGFIASLNHSGKYSDEICVRILDSFNRIASGLVSCQRLSEIQYISDSDIAILDKLNETSAPLQYGDIIDAFRHWVSVTPESTMLTYLDHRYSYADVDRITDSIASALASNGVTRGDSVSMMVSRSEWYVLCVIGILKVGAAYVPIDTSHPDERISYIISNSLSKVVLVTEDTEGRAATIVSGIQASPSIILCNNLLDSKFDAVKVSPKDSAIILYTSGTTGNPKGTLITRLAIESLSEWMFSSYCLTADDVLGLHASIGFDISTMALFPQLVCGGSSDIIPEDVRLDMDRLHSHIQSHRITNMMMTTPLARMYASAHPDGCMKVLFAVGEKLGEFDQATSY